MSKKMLWTRVNGNVRAVVEKLVEKQGTTISEYIRRLVINDLDGRSVFTSALKNELADKPQT